MMFCAANSPSFSLSESTDITSPATDGSVGPSTASTGIPAALAFLIGTTIACVSRIASTIRSGFCATAWLNFWTWVPGSIVVMSSILTPVGASVSVKTLLK